VKCFRPVKSHSYPRFFGLSCRKIAPGIEIFLQKR
jgi:hypothetical protein